jgi:hypothetical protein
MASVQIPMMDQIPFWIFVPVIILLISLSSAVGFWLGRRASHIEHKSEQPIGTKVGATLALLAFTLALTFSMASSRYDDRRQLQRDEAIAIGMAYRRANLLPAPHGPKVRQLLREYVDVRLRVNENPAEIQTILARSEQLQALLWQHAETVVAKDANSWRASWYVESLTQITELHTKRVGSGLYSRVPVTVWLGLGAITVLSMLAMGYQGGLSGSWRLFPLIMLLLSFSVVFTLTADLDRPRAGMIRIDNRHLIDVQRLMHQDQQGSPTATKDQESR